MTARMRARDHLKLAARVIGWRLIEVDPHYEWHFERAGTCIEVRYTCAGTVRRAIRRGNGRFQILDNRDASKRDAVFDWLDEADPQATDAARGAR